jgi:hypothetical protein
MTDRRLVETAARAILASQSKSVGNDEWRSYCLTYWTSGGGSALTVPADVLAAFNTAQVVITAIDVPTPNPDLVFDWQQQDGRTWVAKIAEGWTAKVVQSLGDSTWSFVVNRSGNCYLDSKETAMRLAEEDARKRIGYAIREAARTSRAFSLGLPIEEREHAA